MDNTPIGTNHTEAPPEPSPLQVKQNFWSHNNFTGGGLLIYLALFGGIELVYQIIATVKVVTENPGITNSDRHDEFMELATAAALNGWSFIAALVVGLTALFIYFHKRLPARDIFRSPRKMTGKRFIIVLCIFFAGQLVATVGNLAGEWVLNRFGLSNEAVAETMEHLFDSPSMILYASILGPIAEELVFRGFLMRRFQAWGKMYAIVMSSVLFGLFHMNFIQGPFAFLVGLVFAYTAMEFGIKWSILLHILNNGVFAGGVTMLGKALGDSGETITGYIEYGFMGLTFILGLFFIIKYRSNIKAYMDRNRTENRRYLWAVTTVTLLIFIIFTLGASLLTLIPADLESLNFRF